MQFDSNGNEFWVNQITGVSAWEVKQSTFFHSCGSPFLSAHAHKHTYIHINILYIHTTYPHPFKYTCIHTYIYIHKYPHLLKYTIYIHTYIHTFIHTYIYVDSDRRGRVDGIYRRKPIQYRVVKNTNTEFLINCDKRIKMSNHLTK